jgi:hypothetical protein
MTAFARILITCTTSSCVYMKVFILEQLRGMQAYLLTGVKIVDLQGGKRKGVRILCYSEPRRGITISKMTTLVARLVPMLSLYHE